MRELWVQRGERARHSFCLSYPARWREQPQRSNRNAFLQLSNPPVHRRCSRLLPVRQTNGLCHQPLISCPACHPHSTLAKCAVASGVRVPALDKPDAAMADPISASQCNCLGVDPLLSASKSVSNRYLCHGSKLSGSVKACSSTQFKILWCSDIVRPSFPRQ